MTKRILSGICTVALLLCACFSVLAEDGTSAQELIERMVVSYAAYGERDARALEELSAADPAQAEKWGRLYGRTVNGAGFRQRFCEGHIPDFDFHVFLRGMIINLYFFYE